jgi:hypothetical protein
MAFPVLEYKIKNEDLTKKGLDSATKGINQFEANTKSSMDRLGKFLLSGAFVASLVMITKRVADVGGQLLELGSRAEETQSKFNVVFRGISDEAGAWVEQFSQDLGRSEQQFQSFMATFQDTFVPLGFARDQAFDFSKVLVKLGSDLASFNNEAESETMARLQTAIVGNVEVLRRYGVVINQTILGQELMNMGIEDGVKAATEAEKAQARLNLILKGTADAQGDAARTADSYANRMRRAASIIEGIGTKIGETILPIASELLGVVTENVLQPISDWISNNQERILNFFLRLPEVVEAVGDTVRERLAETFSIEGIRTRIEQVGKWATEMVKNVFDILGTFLEAVGKSIWTPLSWGFLKMAEGIQIAFDNVVNVLIDGINIVVDMINGMVDLINNIRIEMFKIFNPAAIAAARAELEAGLPTGIAREQMLAAGMTIKLPTQEEILQAAGFVAIGQVGKITEFELEDPIKVPDFQTVVDLIASSWKDVGAVTLEAFSEAGQAQADLAKKSAEWMETLRAKIEEIIKQPLPEGFSLRKTTTAEPQAEDAISRVTEFFKEGTRYLAAFGPTGDVQPRPGRLPFLPGGPTQTEVFLRPDPTQISGEFIRLAETINDAFQSITEKSIMTPMERLRGVFEKVRFEFEKIPEILRKGFEEINFGEIGKKVLSFFVDIVKGTDAFQQASRRIRERLTELAEGPVQKLILRMGVLRESTDRFMTGLGTFFESIMGTIGNLIERNAGLIGAIGDFITAALNIVANIVQRIEPIVSMFLRMFTPLIDTIRILIEAFTFGPGEEPGLLMRSLQFLGDAIVVTASLLEVFAGRLSGIIQFLGNVIQRPLQPRTWGEDVDFGPSFSEVVAENLGFDRPEFAAAQVTGGVEGVAPMVPGGATTVTRMPDITLIVQIEGQVVDISGTEWAVVTIPRIVESVQNAITTDATFNVVPQGVTV